MVRSRHCGPRPRGRHRRPAWALAALALVAANALAQAPGPARDPLPPTPSPTASIWTTTRFPQDEGRWWWDAPWWERGHLASAAQNHEVRSRTTAFSSGDAQVPVEILAPRAEGRFPVVVFLHGRRGIDAVTRLVALRLAARGFAVVVPDLYSARFIEKMPVGHDPATEDDAATAIAFALSIPEARGQAKTCVVSHTRGGYYALRALVGRGQQAKVACYVSYYPHWQDPRAPEAAQVYQFAPEVEQLAVPVLVFMGEHEQYQRARSVAAGIDALRAKKRDARLIVYPGVGRGFDFRGPEVRTFADDLAAKDAMLRTADFLREHLAGGR